MTIDWAKAELLPVIAQSTDDNSVLMLAYVNEEALNLTLSSGYAHYFSRSKNRIWKKGESSGHLQKIVDVRADCDSDSILYIVEQNGAACHTGNKSCFYTSILTNEQISKPEFNPADIYGAVDTLYHELLERKGAPKESSYTASLYSKGENTIGKKIVEEAAELAFALKDNNKEQIIYEAADLLYHALVGLAYKEISPDLIRNEIKRRMGVSGHTEKAARVS
ncbi:MAG: hypothetical protein RL154_281 [Pseudomonadota bacterium]|jgi:phosphoribosyl-ATP pyrophosphohydrolase/phosphoribosyl-AMP cyclohydrolase